MKTKIAFFILTTICIMACSKTDDPRPDNGARSIDEVVASYLDQSATKAVSVALIDGDQVNIQHFGRLSEEDSTMPDDASIYEIGSVTKTFTARLLYDMVADGTIALDDPITDYLPEGLMQMDETNSITLQDLVTHTSGLPRLPDNLLQGIDLNDPYAHFSNEKLYTFLSNYTLSEREGRSFEYSNLGVGLLGHILELVSGQSYEDLVTTHILSGLAMMETTITLNVNQQRSLMPGHTEDGEITAPWTFQSMAGAGAFKSTVSDMVRYVKSYLDSSNHDEMFTPIVQVNDDFRVGLGWFISRVNTEQEQLVWHNGGTGGFSSFVGFKPGNRKAIIVLSNCAIEVDELAIELLQSMN